MDKEDSGLQCPVRRGGQVLQAGPGSGSGRFALTSPKRGILGPRFAFHVACVLTELKKLPLASLERPVYLLLTK